MLTMPCVEIIQSADNTMSRKRTGKISNWPPNFKIFQNIHVICHKAPKALLTKYICYPGLYLTSCLKVRSVRKGLLLKRFIDTMATS